MDQERFWNLLRRIRVPLTMVYGTSSGLGDTGLTASIPQALPQALLVRLPGGHHLNVEAPDALARVIVEAGVAARLQPGE